MITLAKFLEGCQKNAARIHGYKQPYSGDNGLSDCIGYIIGALALEGQKWGGTHGSNYAARSRTKNLHRVISANQLKLGEIVYKALKPGESGYALPDKYKQGGNSYNGDVNDYYHVGVVTSVDPLCISHCSTGGMHYDKKLGKWNYAGDCSLVDYSARGATESATISGGGGSPVETTPAITGKAVVDVPDDTSVNVRSKASASAGVITRLPEGSEVTVASVSGAWSRVEYTWTKTGTGYVMSKYLKGDIVDVPDDTSVNVRARASTSAQKVTTIPEGAKVTIISESGSWTKVEFSVQKTGSGYVMSKYLKKG